MKYVLLFLSFYCAGLLYAQPWHTAVRPIDPVYYTPFAQADKSGNRIIVNYDMSDELMAGPAWYKRAIWPINHYNDTLSADSLLTYLIVRYDTLIDLTNTYGYAYTALSNILLDSIWIQLGHVNHSGIDDTLWIDLVKVNTQGYPTQQVFWTQAMVLSSSASPGNNWKQPVWQSLAPGIVLPEDTLFGIRLRYMAPLEDTLGVVAGYRFNNQCPNFDAAQWSAFYPNSYAFWTGFNMLIPTSVEGDLYYDCNGSGTFDTLIDGRNYIQNWSVAIQLSSPDIGFESQASSNSIKIYPNPANNHVFIQSDSPIGIVQLCNLQGAVLTTFQSVDGTITLDGIGTGLYTLIIETEKQVYAKKLLINAR